MKDNIRELIVDIHHIWLRTPISVFFYCLSRVLFLFGIEKKGLKCLLFSIREAYLTHPIKYLKNIIKYDAHILVSNISPPTSKQDVIARTIILSMPVYSDKKVVRKGTLLIKFSHVFSYFIHHSIIEKLNSQFVFILEPSWAGYADADILCFLSHADDCVIQASELQDRILISSLYPNHKATQFGSGNWADPDVFLPRVAHKEFDFIYVANLNPIKRIYRLLRAIVKISKKHPEIRGVIICAGWGKGDLVHYSNFIERHKIEKNIMLRSGVPQKELALLTSSSKVSLLLSYKEGSNRAIFESMLAGVPSLLLAENIGTNKSYVNEHTGLIIKDAFLEDALIYFIDHWRNFNPRQWALDNFTPTATTTQLSKLLESTFGNRVNSHLQLKCNSPELTYIDNSIDRIKINSQLFETFDCQVIDHELLSTFN